MSFIKAAYRCDKKIDDFILNGSFIKFFFTILLLIAIPFALFALCLTGFNLNNLFWVSILCFVLSVWMTCVLLVNKLNMINVNFLRSIRGLEVESNLTENTIELFNILGKIRNLEKGLTVKAPNCLYESESIKERIINKIKRIDSAVNKIKL